MTVVIPLALAALELAHPTWGGASAARAVAAFGTWWLILHVALIVGYALLVLTLWRVPSHLGRLALAAFLVCNTAFLAVDGLAIGLLAPTESATADALWNSPFVVALADATGATWAATLLILAAGYTSPSRLVAIALGTVWIALIVSPVVSVASLVSFAIALAVAAYQVYRGGAAGLPFALLVVAAILPQHVGAEAAAGMLCLALARASVFTGRSTPAASSPL
jgi:hypothetical protein